nr:S-formylglutathione hydrolase [Agarivorans sp. Alg241-V36]
MTIKLLASNKVFGGLHQRYSHQAESTQCEMTFAVYLPPQATVEQPVPLLYWLSGLTCSDENFMQKAGAFKVAAELGMAIVAPDTSPRGAGVADDPEGAYDLGLGAGFYINATQQPWAKHYQMYSYISEELPVLLEQHFPVTQQRAIAGHSMGGHGALSIAFKNPERFSSVSAFSPICQPTTCPWGQKAFTAYLGSDQQAWLEHDSSILIKRLTPEQRLPLLIDQGSDDSFLAEQLKSETLVDAAKQLDYAINFRMQQGYDHSYFFIASFIEDHLRFHYKYF